MEEKDRINFVRFTYFLNIPLNFYYKKYRHVLYMHDSIIFVDVRKLIRLWSPRISQGRAVPVLNSVGAP